MAIAIRGASGFIGKSVSSVSLENQLVPVDRGLVIPRAASCLLHLAWHTDPKTYLESPLNVEAADHAIAAAISASTLGIPFIGVGTCAEYDRSESDLDEESPVLGDTVYAQQKLRALEETRSICEAAGTRWVWARIFFPFGPGEHPMRLVPSVVSALKNERPLDLGPCTQTRDQIDVRDVASALLQLSGSESASGVFNVCTGSGMPLREWLTKMAGDKHDLLRFSEPSSSQELMRVVGRSERLRSLGWRPAFPTPPNWEQLT
jgi:nucleoside-diphosphate-sugar epimerase